MTNGMYHVTKNTFTGMYQILTAWGDFVDEYDLKKDAMDCLRVLTA